MSVYTDMAETGPPAAKPPTAHKFAKVIITDSPQPVPQPQPEPEAPLPPDQVPDPGPPAPLVPSAPAPPAHIPDPVQPPNPPAHVSDPVQLQAPPAHIPHPIQPQVPPAHVPNPAQPPAPPVHIINHMPHLNWSYFKSEFSGKPEEDAETYVLRTNDWMETHNFPEVAKMQRFCLTLTGEAKLWYESLRPIVVDWTGLQECFRQQYSKFGNTQDQLFHVWRSFHYDENVKTIAMYVNRIKQVTVLLNYGEPQILELFKSTLPSRLRIYWVYFLLTI